MIRDSSSYLEFPDLQHLLLRDSERPRQATDSGHHHDPVHHPEVGSAHLLDLEHQEIHPELILDKSLEQAPQSLDIPGT